MNDKVKAAEEWFERGEHDISSAKLIFESGRYLDTTVVLVQQALGKYIKGYLLYQGWQLEKTHDLRRLLSQAMSYDPGFASFLDLARVVTAYYIENRYPPGPTSEYSKEDVAQILGEAKSLIKKIKEALPST